MSLCNYCMLEGIRRGAKKAGERVAIGVDPLSPHFRDGTVVFVHPKSVSSLKARTTLNEEGELKYFAAWFASLPNSCCC